MKDKEIECIEEATNKENTSICCDAPIIAGTFCENCKEHAE